MLTVVSSKIIVTLVTQGLPSSLISLAVLLRKSTNASYNIAAIKASPQSRKVLLVKSGILGLGSRNPESR